MSDYLEKPMLTTEGLVHYAFARGSVLSPILGSRLGLSFDISSDSPIKRVHISYPIPVIPSDNVLLAVPLFAVKGRDHHRGYEIIPFSIQSLQGNVGDVELLRLERDGEVIGYYADTPNNKQTLPGHLVIEGSKINTITLDGVLMELANPR